VVLVLTCTVMLAELVGGLWSGSLVLLADAGHMFSDAAALGLALFAIWFGSRPSPPHRTYGYYRAEILAAVANAVLLGIVTVFIIREGLERLQNPAPFHVLPVLVIGGLGLLVNLIGVRLLHVGARTSLNIRGAYLEVFADLMGSCGVIVAALLSGTFGWVRADPIISLGIAAFIVPRIWLLMREATDVLMEAAPRGMDIEEVRSAILRQAGVLDVHDLHVWTITSGRVCLSAHVVTALDIDRDDVLARTNTHLRERFGLDHTTLQVEGVGASSVEAAEGTACDSCPPSEMPASFPRRPSSAENVAE
jgi:cobalt-zinc-cadmium efflux system protein